MSKPASFLTLLAAAACILAAAPRSQAAGLAPLSVSAVSAPPPVTLADSTGEDASAPDITSLAVSNDDAGVVTFRVDISNRPQLTDDMFVGVYLDTDLNPSDGAGPNTEGAEEVIILSSAGVALAHWNGSDFDVSGQSPTSLVYSYTNGATIEVKATDLGASSFNFYVAAGSGPDNDVHVDYAPDPGHGTLHYDVEIAPQTQLKLVARHLGVFPKPPKAPGELDAALVVTRLDTHTQVRSGTVLCRAKVGKRTVPLIVKGDFYKGTVNCNWRLPKWAAGKKLTGTITVTFQGATVARTFSVKIRNKNKKK
jgi:hypothetical protein